MNILIPTIGSRGDVQPFIALSQGLQSAGYTPTLASHPVMRDLVEAHGVAFAPLGPDLDLSARVAEIRQSARNPMVGLMNAMRFSFEILEQSHEDILALCKDADLLVVPTASAAGKNEADVLGLPYLSVTLMPWAIPYDDPQRPLPKRMLYGAIDGLVSLITTRPLNRIRRKQGLPPVGKEGFGSSRLDLVPVSPAVFPPNPHWETCHQVVGYWFVEEPSDWEPPVGLSRFLEGGGPPLVVSLGAMSLGGEGALETARLFVEAVRQAGVQAVVQGWQAELPQLDLPAAVYPAAALPHGWLLPRCSGLVHHGGYGTTAAGFRAGIPQLVIPHIADQFYWGQRVQELGVGPAPFPRNKLDTGALASAMRELVYNAAFRNAAVAIAGQIQTETGAAAGAAKAVRLIEETFIH